MRRLSFGNVLPGQNGFAQWATSALREIERASAEDIEAVLSGFAISGTVTETRTLDVDTAGLPDLLQFVATIVIDIQKRGQKRSYGA